MSEEEKEKLGITRGGMMRLSVGGLEGGQTP